MHRVFRSTKMILTNRSVSGSGTIKEEEVRTTELKALAEEREEEYNEWVKNQLKKGNKEARDMDIFTWVGMQCEEHARMHDEFLKEEGLFK